MDDLELAKTELDWIQEIIARHEGRMDTIRAWLLAIIGGLLAGYYTANIQISPLELRVALIGITILFLWVETRHVNLIDAVIERSTKVEREIQTARTHGTAPGWYDGPKLNETAASGVKRRLPLNEMTLKLNLPFYFVVAIVIGLTVVALPQKPKAVEAAATACCGSCTGRSC